MRRALWEKDRNRKNLQSLQRLVELWKGIVSISIKAVAVGTEEGENLRHLRQRQHWFTSHYVVEREEEEMTRVPRFSCLSPVTGWVMDVIHGEGLQGACGFGGYGKFVLWMLGCFKTSGS